MTRFYGGLWDWSYQDVPGGLYDPPQKAWGVSLSIQPLNIDFQRHTYLRHICQMAAGLRTRMLMISRLRYPQSSILSLVIVLSRDYTYCPNCPNLMFSKLSTSMVKSKGNILLRIELLKVK